MAIKAIRYVTALFHTVLTTENTSFPADVQGDDQNQSVHDQAQRTHQTDRQVDEANPFFHKGLEEKIEKAVRYHPSALITETVPRR
jgi:hypothetical protein